MTNTQKLCAVCGDLLDGQSWAIFPMVAVGPTDPETNPDLGLQFFWQHAEQDDSKLQGIAVHAACLPAFIEGLLIQAKVEFRSEEA